jgi:hypothetical protein
LLLPGTQKNNKKQQKIYVKQSYMLLTWVLYIKNMYNSKKNLKKCSPSFFVFPKFKKKITIIKSPMAHKTFSQEQYIFQFYTLSVSYSIPKYDSSTSSAHHHPIPTNMSFSTSLLFLLKHREVFNLNLGTNLFFTKRIIFYSSWSDKKFLNFF